MRIALLALLLLTAGCTTAPTAGAPSAAATGRTQQRLTVAGRARTYELHRARQPAGAAGYPVLFAFHGAGSTAASLARAGGFDARATRDGWIVVYPHGVNARFDTRRGSADVAFVQAILGDLARNAPIDRTRIHATGFSNGGFLCYRLAHDLPGTFASIAPVAGLMPRDALPRSTRTALLHVHGTADRVVPEGGRGGTYGAGDGALAWSRAAEGLGSVVVQAEKDAAPQRVESHIYVTKSGTSVRLIRLEGVGHAWPGGAEGWLSRTIWRSFQQSPHAPR